MVLDAHPDPISVSIYRPSRQGFIIGCQMHGKEVPTTIVANAKIALFCLLFIKNAFPVVYTIMAKLCSGLIISRRGLIDVQRKRNLLVSFLNRST